MLGDDAAGRPGGTDKGALAALGAARPRLGFLAAPGGRRPAVMFVHVWDPWDRTQLADPPSGRRPALRPQIVSQIVSQIPHPRVPLARPARRPVRLP
jgi:hypothetical protein